LEWIAKEAFRNIGASVLELGWGMRRMNRSVFFRTVQVEGLDIIQSALSRKKGAIILPAHYGNWEIMANAVGYLGIHAYFVAKTLKNPYLDKMVNDYRCETGNKVIYMNGASREMRKAATTPLLAKLHLMTGAPLVLVKCYPLKDGRCR
jgi:KDO2-lipid IV(A) lauroyltransferase